MRRFLFLIALAACAPAPPPPPTAAPVTKAPEPALSAVAETKAIHAVLDDWHQAAAAADEERYFSHFTDDGIFMGTDATERWTTTEFRAYAHPHFAKGKAWRFKAVRRDVMFADGLRTAWFDEDLDTPNLGPARGSGVVRRGDDGVWRIAHYNLAVTVSNERFGDVKDAIAGKPAPVPPPQPCIERPEPPPAPRPPPVRRPKPRIVPKARPQAPGF